MRTLKHNETPRLVTVAKLAVSMNFTTAYVHMLRHAPDYPREEIERRNGRRCLFDGARFKQWFMHERTRPRIGRPPMKAAQTTVYFAA